MRAIRSLLHPKGRYGGRPYVTAPNVLDRQFKMSASNTWRVTDITYIQTQEGFLFLAVVLDLFSCWVIEWSMGNPMTEQLVQDALSRRISNVSLSSPYTCILTNKYKTREKAKQALFHYIEVFYNPIRRHIANQRLSPADYERRYFMALKSV